MTSALPWGPLVALAVFVVVLAPPGYWVIQRLDGTAPHARDLALALGVGLATMLPLLWLERIAGAPVLVLPATALAVVALRKHWRHWLSPGVGPFFVVLPALLGGLAAWVDAGDVRWVADAASVRMGFEVTDRAFYSLVAQEILRDPIPPLQNPVFSGVTFAYSYFPALAGLLLHLYGGLDLLSVFQVHLPVVCFVFIGLAVDRLLLDWGVTSLLARALTPALCVLGGDLSFLFPARGVMGAERSAHFLAFCSFSAESLYYNPWMLALPLALVTLVLGARWLREGGRGRLLLAAWSLAALWQTKFFACVPLLLGVLAAAALLRRRRLLELGLLSAALVVPWAALSVIGGDPAAARPLLIDPLLPVAQSLAVHPSWARLAAWCGPDRAPLVRWPAVAVATLLVTLGGLGVRVMGAAVLARRARSDPSGFWSWLGLTVVAALALGMLVVGDPLPLNGAQFLILPQLLLWTLTGPWLAGWLHAGGARRIVATVLVVASCLSPMGYVLRKTWPERFTSPATVDRYRFALPPESVAAAGWLARQPASRANLVADWRGGAGDPGGRAPLYLAALANKRLAAYEETFAIAMGAAAERRRQVVEVYETADASRAEALLDSMRADWVWVDTRRPLRFASPRLPLRVRSGAVELHEFVRQRAP